MGFAVCGIRAVHANAHVLFMKHAHYNEGIHFTHMEMTIKTDTKPASRSERTLVFAADHGGFEMKGVLLDYARELGYKTLDAGTFSPDSVDYPDYAEKAARAVLTGRAQKAVLICGTGVGVSISANKIPGIRCALCGDATTARLTTEHNDSNAIAIGARVVGIELAKDILKAWLDAEFIGGRHAVRVGKIAALEAFDLNSAVMDDEYR